MKYTLNMMRVEENMMLSELKTIPEYETYEDYVESRAAVDLGVVPKDFFESIKKTRFQVWMINFGYYLDTLFKSPEEAESAGKATGFEFKVEENMMLSELKQKED